MGNVITAAELRRQAAQAREIAEQLARDASAATRAELEASRPKCPVLIGEGDSAMVGFTRYQSGREYRYAAIGWRTGRSVRWMVTGEETRRFNWPGLLAFIGEANWSSLVRLVEGERLLPEGVEPPVAEEMGRFGRVLGSSTPFAPGGYDGS
ncbi:hypothetical protein I5G62_gp88 [Mycobacterium phage CRB2]|uniref:Uncharacterized protein n=1 Tax=Mycobacterium phage CRB2 TaxID=2483623 RepID=A0A455LM44_9CAUD|nr:hypothetical protein I5G62_gp88 [Mycobacterium phage CRB2]AYP70074.1 hypothetical protein CRB2_88 [Mycobacterium phage CRB2]